MQTSEADKLNKKSKATEETQNRTGPTYLNSFRITKITQIKNYNGIKINERYNGNKYNIHIVISQALQYV